MTTGRCHVPSTRDPGGCEVPRPARDTLVPPPPASTTLFRSDPLLPQLLKKAKLKNATRPLASMRSATRPLGGLPPTQNSIADNSCLARRMGLDQKDGRRSATRLSGSWPTARHAHGSRRRARSVTWGTPREVLDETSRGVRVRRRSSRYSTDAAHEHEQRIPR